MIIGLVRFGAHAGRRRMNEDRANGSPSFFTLRLRALVLDEQCLMLGNLCLQSPTHLIAFLVLCHRGFIALTLVDRCAIQSIHNAAQFATQDLSQLEKLGIVSA